MKNVSVLGSTGSIGKQTLEVAAANPDKIKIRALAAHTSDVLLEEIFTHVSNRDESAVKKCAELCRIIAHLKKVI